MSRGEDDSKIDAFGEENLAAWEAMCAKHSDKWLFGTSEPTLMDVHCSFAFEMLALFEGSVMQNVIDRLDVRNKAPSVFKFVERWHAHPDLAPYHSRRKVAAAHWARFRTLPKGEKAALNHECWPSSTTRRDELILIMLTSNLPEDMQLTMQRLVTIEREAERLRKLQAASLQLNIQREKNRESLGAFRRQELQSDAQLWMLDAASNMLKLPRKNVVSLLEQNQVKLTAEIEATRQEQKRVCASLLALQPRLSDMEAGVAAMLLREQDRVIEEEAEESD